MHSLFDGLKPISWRVTMGKNEITGYLKLGLRVYCHKSERFL